MNETDVVGQLVGFLNIVLGGVSVFFTIISAYVAGLNYFIHRGSLAGKIAAFAFLTFVIGLLLAIMRGAAQLHDGLILRLRELQTAGHLTAAGEAALSNAARDAVEIAGRSYPIDAAVSGALWTGVALTYAGLFIMTFLMRWKDKP